MSTQPPEDPWEARERERANWRRASRPEARSGNSSGSKASPPSSGTEDGGSGLAADIVAWGTIAAIAVLLCSEIPRIAPPERETFARIGSGAILLLIGFAREFQDRLLTAIRRGPNPVILLLFGWSIFEFFHSPFRGYATTEIMRVFDGIGAYFLCAYCLRVPRQTGLVVAGILFTGVVFALLDLAHVGGGSSAKGTWYSIEYGILGTHQNVGSFLMLLFPIGLALAVLPGVEEKRRLTAIAASLVIGAGLLIARPRSAWIGSLFGLLILAYLHFRYANTLVSASGEVDRLSLRRQSRLSALLGSPLILFAGAVLLFLISTGVAPVVMSRVSSIQGFKREESFTGRTELWAGAARMASEQPVLGRGLGSFEVLQGRWTHFGTEIEVALSKGVGDENMAHDYFIQWAADTGGVGLFLYAFVVGVFLLSACRAIPRTTVPVQRAVLCGCIASVTAGVIDGIASPAYYFHGISTLYWCIMGLGVASMRPPRQRRLGDNLNPDAPALERTRLSTWIIAGVFSAAVVACVLGLGFAMRRIGNSAPRGRLELSLQPTTGPVYPGQTLRWTAFYHDAGGAEHGTMPGTLWHLANSDSGAAANPKMTLGEWSGGVLNLRHEVINVVVPSMKGTLTMHARYSDQYGRWYDAYSEQEVRPAPSTASHGH